MDVIARRQLHERRVVVGRRDANLVEIIGARHAVGCLADLLDRRQQQADQNCDDRDHDQQFDQRKA